ncbi:hypothetical protein JD844_015982 [Phrynosoma platyrhinos]|uniref:Uncharacterized protein n=1 Tax=Phrynosoma platyrhinos TaxID=52577 RepID=A0ABQ7SJV0_PHRPL|nr:hypothetical protein JD844_015982 [Phrynosoma platyrhinos]
MLRTFMDPINQDIREIQKSPQIIMGRFGGYKICKSNGLLVLNESLIPGVSEQHKPEVTKERITYSRDSLLKLSEVSLAQKKPEFLPDHPIVLEKPYIIHLQGNHCNSS